MIDRDDLPSAAATLRPGTAPAEFLDPFEAPTADLTVGDGVSAVRWVPFAEAMAMEVSIARPVGGLAGTLAHRP